MDFNNKNLDATVQIRIGAQILEGALRKRIGNATMVSSNDGIVECSGEQREHKWIKAIAFLILLHTCFLISLCF